MNNDQKERFRKLAEDYSLTADDFFKHKHYVIIKKSGIRKIKHTDRIVTTYFCEHAGKDYAAVMCKASDKNGLLINTYGSAHSGNCQNTHYLEMAEKRAEARAVLEIADLYSYGFYGEDENYV